MVALQKSSRTRTTRRFVNSQTPPKENSPSRTRAGGIFEWLVCRYYASVEFGDLDEITKKRRREFSPAPNRNVDFCLRRRLSPQWFLLLEAS